VQKSISVIFKKKLLNLSANISETNEDIDKL